MHGMIFRQRFALQMRNACALATGRPPGVSSFAAPPCREFHPELTHGALLIEYLLNQVKQNRRRRAVDLWSVRLACDRPVTGDHSIGSGPLTARSQAHEGAVEARFAWLKARPTSSTAPTATLFLERRRSRPCGPPVAEAAQAELALEVGDL